MARRRTSRLRVYGLVGLVLILASIGGGWLLSSRISEPSYDAADQTDISKLVDGYFQQGLQQMLDKRYSLAADTWQKLLLVNEPMPEVHANLGFSLIELQQFERAREHFLRALDLNAYQANAYYGLAICLEQLDDIAGALGAMRSYIHLADGEDPFLRRARSALWEWETRMQRQRVNSDTSDAKPKDGPISSAPKESSDAAPPSEASLN